MRVILVYGWWTLASLLCTALGHAQMPDPPGQVGPSETPQYEAYLFAHMMQGDYGRLYYSISVDGLHWKLLNGGKRICEDYGGHPDICPGHDGRIR